MNSASEQRRLQDFNLKSLCIPKLLIQKGNVVSNRMQHFGLCLESERNSEYEQQG
jgi:hypothetical protein